MRSTVIYCGGRPLLVCHDNYMISDCWCRGAGGGAHVRARGTRGASHARRAGNRCCCGGAPSRSCASRFCVPPPQPPCCVAPPGLVVAAAAVPQLTRIFQPHPPPGFYIIPTRPAHEWTRSSPAMCVSGFRTRR